MNDPTIDLNPANLEDNLRTDADGKLRDAVVARLAEKAADVKRQMDAGVAPAEFEKLDGIHKALSVSEKVIKVAWRRLRTKQLQLEKGETE